MDCTAELTKSSLPSPATRLAGFDFYALHCLKALVHAPLNEMRLQWWKDASLRSYLSMVWTTD